MLVAVWVILSFIVGILGRKTVLGFWGAFIFSLFLVLPGKVWVAKK